MANLRFVNLFIEVSLVCGIGCLQLAIIQVTYDNTYVLRPTNLSTQSIELPGQKSLQYFVRILGEKFFS